MGENAQISWNLRGDRGKIARPTRTAYDASANEDFAVLQSRSLARSQCRLSRMDARCVRLLCRRFSSRCFGGEFPCVEGSDRLEPDRDPRHASGWRGDLRTFG